MQLKFKTKKAVFILLITAISLLNFSNTYAQNKYALLIGIDIYNPPDNQTASIAKTNRDWMNLDGCVNDAVSVGEILKSRFEFKQENIGLLINSGATREKILASIEKLIDKAKPGDAVVIYYAGHGSQITNSMSKEADKKDETMVPSDAIFGVKDIRDKELAALFNKFLEKGVILTIIYDSCHSGSIGRGLMTEKPSKMRYATPDINDVKDATIISSPEEKGALIISAAQDYEFACEQVDEFGNPHGAFTVALLQSLKSVSVNASATEMFESIRAIMKYNGKKQEPVIAGSDKRRDETIFGIERGSVSGKTIVAVIKPTSADSIQLQGGYAVGLNVNCELLKTIGNDTIRVKITEMQGVNQCNAKLISGNLNKIKPGDLFELYTWSTANGPNLKLFIPKSELGYSEILDFAKGFEELKTNKSISWIKDPAIEAPTHTIFFNDGNWYLGTPDSKIINLGKKPAAKDINTKIKGQSKLFISLPPTEDFAKSLTAIFAKNNSIEVTKNAADAQYFLTSRMINNELEYALYEPLVSSSDTAILSTMPICTDYFKLSTTDKATDITSEKIKDIALKLAKIKVWLTLASPPESNTFPFYIALKNMRTKETMTSGDVLEGDTIAYMMVTDTKNEKLWDEKKRYIYMFAIDIQGRMQLLYPKASQGSVENLLPKTTPAGVVLKEQKLGRYKVSPPFGYDTFIMLTTDEPIPNLNAFDQQGVCSRGIGGSNTLADLVNIGANTRGAVTTPANWSISRISVQSLPRK